MFSLEEYIERAKQIAEAGSGKMECSEDDPLLNVGVIGMFTHDGQSLTDFQYCCGRHLMTAIALLKNVAEELLVENGAAEPWELNEIWEEAQEMGDLSKYHRDPLVEDDSKDLGSWLDGGGL